MAKKKDLRPATKAEIQTARERYADQLYANAAILKSDSGENREYDRALVELVAYSTGADTATVAARLGINA